LNVRAGPPSQRTTTIVNYLFIHQNFPGQYRHIAAHLASQPGNQVYFITQPNHNSIPGVYKVTYTREQRRAVNCHAYSVELDRAISTGAAAADACRRLRDQGFTPDLVVGHAGWGETLFIKDVFPDVPLLANFEFYYHTRGVDVDFDPEFTSTFNDPSLLRARNGVALIAFQGCDWGHSATQWQRSLHPRDLQSRISVVHEGVDTTQVRPRSKASFRIPGKRLKLTCQDEVLTYVARNLEPYRGFHIFMRSLPQLMRRRKRLHVVIVGGDEVSYGAPPPPQSTYRAQMLDEVGSRIDPDRVHFMGQVDYLSYLSLLQVSSAHVYLTYPFVLSWSFIEALASGCLVVGSKTPPVLEVLRNRVNGLTVDFFSPVALADSVESALEEPEKMRKLRAAARDTAVKSYDLKKVMIPRWLQLFESLTGGRMPAI
jgi:glycosyltransferase involved in cell wall biosynthesis